jgi:hypothetical protein
MLLDGAGKATGTVRNFLGASVPFDIAAQGSEVGILAQRASGEVEFRPLAADGHPLGGWICLDGPSTDPFEFASIDTEQSTGYAVLYRTPGYAETLVRFDHLGVGAP